jgi:hypothetical protein
MNVDGSNGTVAIGWAAEFQNLTLHKSSAGRPLRATAAASRKTAPKVTSHADPDNVKRCSSGRGIRMFKNPILLAKN